MSGMKGGKKKDRALREKELVCLRKRSRVETRE